jgi:hypothetical protein
MVWLSLVTVLSVYGAMSTRATKAETKKNRVSEVCIILGVEGWA